MSVRVVFDCMIYLQAATNENGPAYACLRLVEEGALSLYLDRETLAEVRDVLGRQRLRRKFKRLTDELVDEFLQAVAARAVMLDDVPRIFEYRRDPDDEPYLNLAIAAKARYLVSRDNDLLDLMRDSAFTARFPTISILQPPDLLRELAGSKAGENPGA
jgi:putative PIN family toxin of toxin-antitoxin system